MLAMILEQSLNGLQYGLMLFLLAAGLTLVFGIMDLINLAHGALYMIGAFLALNLFQFYVFWEDQRQAPLAGVYAARVTKQGTVLDPTGVELFTDSIGYRVSAAWDGSNFLVVTREHC
jgi:branched-subunit amino acid ABC-type transport system permease component